MGWFRKNKSKSSKEAVKDTRERGPLTKKVLTENEYEVLKAKADAYDRIVESHGVFLRQNQIIK